MRNTIIILLVFIVLFSGCATVPAGDSGLLKGKCSEPLSYAGETNNESIVLGLSTGVGTYLSHPDLAKLFLYDKNAGDVYMEYIESMRSNQSLFTAAMSIGILGILSSFAAFGLEGDAQIASVMTCIISIAINLPILTVKMVGAADMKDKSEKAINAYNASCGF